MQEYSLAHPVFTFVIVIFLIFGLVSVVHHISEAIIAVATGKDPHKYNEPNDTTSDKNN